ncbi:MAG: Gfo/Idh/MocA family protein [Thermomicrobiales bacterium]
MATTVALVGVTHPHARMYLDTLDALDEVAGVVLCDADTQAASEVATRVPKVVGVYGELAEALADPAVTHVLVALPNDQTPAALVRAIEAGKSVFAEKPCARSAAEFAPVRAALARQPVPFGVAYLNRAHPAMRQIRELYQAGALGRLTAVELRMVTTQVRLRNPNHWLFKRAVAGGGILTWLGCHWLDLVRYLTGDEYASVSAQLATLGDDGIDVEDTAAVTFRLAGGAVGSLYAGYLLPSGPAGYEGTSYDQAVILRGTAGTVTFQRDRPLLLESIAPGWGDASPRAYDFTLPAARGYGGRHGLAFFQRFFSATPDEATLPGAVDALRVLEVLDAIYEAGRTGRTVEVARQV